MITLAIVGLYLLWRSRQADMGSATTTAGWAILVMVAVTAIAAWPVRSANIADQTLITTLGVVHDAVGPRAQEHAAGQCDDSDARSLRGQSAAGRPGQRHRDRDDAVPQLAARRARLGRQRNRQEIRPGLYDAKSLTWGEAEQIRDNPATRDATDRRQEATQWKKVAEQIKTEDPEAYEYLQGINGMDRIGAGFIAVLAAVHVRDVRPHRVAARPARLPDLPLGGHRGPDPRHGRPAAAGQRRLRRLGNAVVAAVFNIAIFGTGAAIYLFAVDLIMNTASLPGWLQVVLVWLCGVVGWLLLRPYRRITQLGGKDGTARSLRPGSWHRRFFRDMREAAKLDVAGGGRHPRAGHRQAAHRLRRADQPAARGTAGGPGTLGGGRQLGRPSARPERPAQRPDGDESVHRRAAGDRPAEPGTGRAAPASDLDRTGRRRAPAVVRDLPAGDREHRPASRRTPRVRTEAK